MLSSLYGSQSYHGEGACVSNSMKQWAMAWRGTREGPVIVLLGCYDKRFMTKNFDPRMGWQTPPILLQWKPLDLHEKAKRYDSRRWAPRSEGAYMLLGKSEGQVRIAPERMKPLGQSRNDTQLWMHPVVKVKSYAVKKNIAQ